MVESLPGLSGVQGSLPRTGKQQNPSSSPWLLVYNTPSLIWHLHFRMWQHPAILPLKLSTWPQLSASLSPLPGNTPKKPCFPSLACSLCLTPQSELIHWAIGLCFSLAPLHMKASVVQNRDDSVVFTDQQPPSSSWFLSSPSLDFLLFLQQTRYSHNSEFQHTFTQTNRSFLLAIWLD